MRVEPDCAQWMHIYPLLREDLRRLHEQQHSSKAVLQASEVRPRHPQAASHIDCCGVCGKNWRDRAAAILEKR